MKVIWSDFAAQALKDIFDYHKEVAGRNIAQKLKAKIFDSTRQLQKYPGSGQVESSLEELVEGHRYIVRGNYKIIYKKVREGILITDVFDTRQDPVKMNDPKRKAGR
jgi:toxin ParE1/3/4